MRNFTSVTLNKKEIIVKELTVRELDGLLLGQDKKETSLMDFIWAEDQVAGDQLQLATGLTNDELSALAPSRLRELVNAVKEVNAEFYRALSFEKKRAEETQEALKAASRR